MPSEGLTTAVAAAAPDDVVVTDALFGELCIEALSHARCSTRMLVHWLGGGPALLQAQVHAADGVIATSGVVRDALPAIPSVVVAQPGVQVPAIPQPRPNAVPRVIAVGPVTVAKGMLDVARACASWPGPAPTLTLVGDHGLEPGYVAQIRALADLSLELTGPVPPDRALALMASSDLYVSASRMESFGMASAEALALGLPVVLTATGDVALCLAPQRGRVVPVDDREGLVSAIHDALDEAPAERRPEVFGDWRACARAFCEGCGLTLP